MLSDQPIATRMIDTSQLTQNLPKLKGPGFFDKDGAWRDVLGTVLDGISMASGGPGAYWATKQKVRNEQREDARWQKRWDVQRQADIEDRDYNENKPQYISGSEDRVKFDPRTGAATTIYDAPSKAEEYARGMGYEPGTDQYRTAMKDYTLRGWGDSALDTKTLLENIRQKNRVQLKGTPSYSNLNPRPPAGGRSGVTPTKVIGPILAKIARGEKLTPGEQQAMTTYKPPRPVDPISAIIANMGGGTPPAAPAPRTAPRSAPQRQPAGNGPKVGQTATNRQTGKQVRWSGQAWVPVN